MHKCMQGSAWTSWCGLSSETLCCRRAGHMVSRTGAKRRMSMEMHAQAAKQWSDVGAAHGCVWREES
jgi:hypothetical protein